MVAWRLLWLTYEARRSNRVKWLWNGTNGKPEPPSLQEAVLWIARLVGFLGRKRDGAPGIKTLWRSRQALQAAVLMYRIVRSLSHVSSYG